MTLSYNLRCEIEIIGAIYGWSPDHILELEIGDLIWFVEQAQERAKTYGNFK